MKILEIDYTTKIEFSSPVSDHYFMLRCVPVSRDGQTVIARNLSITPEVPLITSRDIFGNISYQGRIDFPHTELVSHSTATVIVDRDKGCNETCYPLYKYNTPLTQTSIEMEDFLYSLFENTDFKDSAKSKKIHPREFSLAAEIIREGIHNVIDYVPGSTNVRTTAQEAFKNGKGVCQDYSQIFCSLCRTAGIPARYIAGTSQGEGSTHAWAEYFVPDNGTIATNGTTMQGRWYGVDCTRNKNTDNTYVILASGRDYQDCKVDGGIFRGVANQTMTVFVKTQEKEIRRNQDQEHSHPVFNLEEQKKLLKQRNQNQQM
ncbi:transglutaminase family protein [Treponema sp.]|uniref:transglutaminase family protein n=1 Tax=Treponema sp. TaxID=166 RepID=UPI00298DB8F4|nr:transglutaminase family protein [Treponema sp.]MCQ2240343.1 transglutaminase family protein [Treponema sp.]